VGTYLLFASSSGYGLFHAHGFDEIGQNTEIVTQLLTSIGSTKLSSSLLAFQPFQSALDALTQYNAVFEGGICFFLLFSAVNWFLKSVFN